MQLNLLIWVTSNCNLACPLCMVKHTMACYPGYEMSMDEVNEIISSSKKRGIHYDTITLTGGEATEWPNLKQALKALYISKIADNITLITNGTNIEKIIEVKPFLNYYAVSYTQCGMKRKAEFDTLGHTIIYNGSDHVELPTEPIEGTTPAECCNANSFVGIKQNQVHYIAGKVYYCCYVKLFENVIPITPDMVCDFKDDFISHFSGKNYKKEICKYCICNQKVWKQI